jgi:uncharacterized protein YciI
MKNYFCAALLLLTTSIVTFAQEEPKEFEVQEGDTSYIMKQYIMCFLKAGPNRNQSKEEAETIQAGHLAHLNALAETGKISLAGPFGDDGQLRGIVIYNVGTMEEAKQLAAEDPAVKAGRLEAEFHPWWGAKGTVLK